MNTKLYYFIKNEVAYLYPNEDALVLQDEEGEANEDNGYESKAEKSFDYFLNYTEALVNDGEISQAERYEMIKVIDYSDTLRDGYLNLLAACNI